MVIVDSKQIEEAQIETFNESANNLANLTLNLLEIFDLVLQSPGVESNKCYGLGGGGGIWHILLHAPLMHLRAKDVH